MDPGTFLLVAGVLLIIFSGLIAFQVMPGISAKTPGGVDVSVTTRASKTIPGTTLEVRSALLIGWFFMGCVLTAAGIYVVLDNQSLDRQERLARLKDDVQERIEKSQDGPRLGLEPTLAETPTPIVGTRPTPTPAVGPTKSAQELFEAAFSADQAGKNDEAIAGYQAALDAGLSGEEATLARLEIGLLESIALESPQVQASSAELALRCENAQANLVAVAGVQSAGDLTTTARDALVEIESVCE